MALKYIADGFRNDAESLLNEFALEEKSEYQVFAAIWQKKNFTFVYMGRETVKELVEFTNEIFTLSLNVLVNNSFWCQIGVVFLLYNLYKNQILDPPIRIRTELSKFEIMKHLLNTATVEKLHSLHYVLNFLLKNALELVAFPILFGPCVRIFDQSKSEFEKKIQMSNFKCNLEEIIETNVLGGLRESFLMYDKLKPTPCNSYANNHCNKLMSNLNNLAADHVSIYTNSTGLQMPSAGRSRHYLKKISCEYPFLNSDLNQITDVDDPNGKDNYINKNDFDDSKLLENYLLKINDGVVQVSKSVKKKSSKRRVVKTRRIRKYYEGSPTKNTVCVKALQISRVKTELHTDS